MAKLIDCFYGQSGTGKSESIRALMVHFYQQFGLTSRAMVGDGSRATYEDLEEEGICEIVDYTVRPWPLSTFQQLCDGYWPDTADIRDPLAPLKAPKPEDLLKLGVVAIEGLAVGSQYIMGDMKGGLAEQAGRGIKIGQDSPVVAKDVEYDNNGNPIRNTGTGLSFGGNPVAHYGFAQRRLLANVERSKRFPNMVIWTSHEMAAENKISKEKLIGPEVAGQALTANLPRHFNNTLHFATAASKAKKKDDHTEKMVDELDVEFRIYTRDHFDAEGNNFVKYKSITRGIPPSRDGGKDGGMHLFLTSNVPGESILEFYEIVRNFKERRRESLKKKGA